MSGVAEAKLHGGKRRGAGRKRSKYRLDAPHRSREEFTTPAPVHVTMRAEQGFTAFRSEAVYQVLLAVLVHYKVWVDFRIVHFSIQENHLHMIVEAHNSAALEHGMRSFSIRSARAINAAFGIHGRVFFRYHSTVIRTKRYARNVIAYVLGNWRRHKQDIVNGRLLDALLDRYSSAISFEGWNQHFDVPAGYRPLPVAAPSTYLLRRGWAYSGPLDPWQAPGPLWS